MTDRQLQPSEFPGALRYEHSDVPPGMTLRAWRLDRARARRRRRRWRLPWRRPRDRR